MYGVEQTPVGNGLRYNTLHRSSVLYKRDWRTALRTPLTYRIGNRSVRFNYHLMIIIASFCCISTIIYYFHNTNSVSQRRSNNICLREDNNLGNTVDCHQANEAYSITLPMNIPPELIKTVYNNTYPLTKAITDISGSITYRIGMVADLDTNSKIDSNGINSWRSLFKKGYLTWNGGNSEIDITDGTDRSDASSPITIQWDANPPNTLETQFSLKERGLELSELVTFNGKLLSFDDRTGLVYELTNNKVIPWIILLDGDGHSSKGFKSEWATVKDNYLYIGSMGKEWTTDSGEFENNNPMFVKVVSMHGVTFSLDWSKNFKRLRQRSANINWPGYMIHESAVWSSIHRKWFFMPRRCSKGRYNSTLDEFMGCTLLITADEDFDRIETVPLVFLDDTHNTRGASSFKFLPNTNDRIIVALRSEEVNGRMSTYITAFNINGRMLLPEEKVDTENKYEGFEFI